MDIRKFFPSWDREPTTHYNRISRIIPNTSHPGRLQYGNPRWTQAQEDDYQAWRKAIPFTNLEIAAGYLRLARTVSSTLALAYRTRAGQIKNGRRVSRKDYHLVLPFLATSVTLRRPSGDVERSPQDQADYAKVAPSKIPPAQLIPAGFRKVSR